MNVIVHGQDLWNAYARATATKVTGHGPYRDWVPAASRQEREAAKAALDAAHREALAKTEAGEVLAAGDLIPPARLVAGGREPSDTSMHPAALRLLPLGSQLVNATEAHLTVAERAEGTGGFSHFEKCADGWYEIMGDGSARGPEPLQRVTLGEPMVLRVGQLDLLE